MAPGGFAVIDRKLNYGRDVVRDFASAVAPFSSVLDIGAGSGADLALAKAASPGAALHAIESYPPNVRTLAAQGIDVACINVERERLPFADEALDLVMANQVLEHLKDIFWVFHEVSRTLKVGGHFILGVPNLASLHNRLLLSVGYQPTCIQNHSAHVRGYTRHDLMRLFTMAFPGGYTLERFRGSNFYPLPPILARPAARLMPNAAASIFLLLKKQRAYAGEFLEHPVRCKLESNFYLGEQAGAGETAHKV